MANGLFGGGDGNPATPFLVEDGADLNAVRNALGKAYKQVANVDLSAYANFVPIGTLATPFTGVYDGGGFSVSNLNINTAINYVGLFGYITGFIQGVNILSGSINVTGQYIGAITGHSSNDVKFCSNQGCNIIRTGGTPTNQAMVGGVIGNGHAYDSFNTANITSTGTGIAGIVGSVAVGSATRCYNTGNITTSGNTAHGVCYGNATNCYNTGEVKSTLATGSSIAGVSGGNAVDSYNVGLLTIVGNTAIYGVCAGNATRCYNTANISCGGTALGVSAGAALDCFNTGTVESLSGTAYGVSFSSATRCYNTGNIRAFLGGYGITVGTANNCYALCNTITRIAGSSATTTWAKVSKTSTPTTNYALDTMTLVYE